MEDKIETLKELSWKFITEIEEQYGDQGLPDSWLPLLHYLRELDKKN